MKSKYIVRECLYEDNDYSSGLTCRAKVVNNFDDAIFYLNSFFDKRIDLCSDLYRPFNDLFFGYEIYKVEVKENVLIGSKKYDLSSIYQKKLDRLKNIVFRKEFGSFQFKEDL